MEGKGISKGKGGDDSNNHVMFLVDFFSLCDLDLNVQIRARKKLPVESKRGAKPMQLAFLRDICLVEDSFSSCYLVRDVSCHSHRLLVVDEDGDMIAAVFSGGRRIISKQKLLLEFDGMIDFAYLRMMG